jgi:hypothetical protein
MCYSSEVTKESILVNFISCVLLYFYYPHPNARILALFFFFVGLMQYFDLIFWVATCRRGELCEHEKEKNETNFIFTKLAMIINHLQPIFLAFLIYFYKGNLGRYSKKILILYTIVISIYSIYIFNKIDYTLPKKTSDGKTYLFWQWTDQKYKEIVYFIFLLTLFALVYENFPKNLNYILIFIIFASYVLSFHKNSFSGRFWCTIAAWIPLFILIFGKSFGLEK